MASLSRLAKLATSRGATGRPTNMVVGLGTPWYPVIRRSVGLWVLNRLVENAGMDWKPMPHLLAATVQMGDTLWMRPRIHAVCDLWMAVDRTAKEYGIGTGEVTAVSYDEELTVGTVIARTGDFSDHPSFEGVRKGLSGLTGFNRLHIGIAPPPDRKMHSSMEMEFGGCTDGHLEDAHLHNPFQDLEVDILEERVVKQVGEYLSARQVEETEVAEKVGDPFTYDARTF